jgi:putative transposase
MSAGMGQSSSGWRTPRRCSAVVGQPSSGWRRPWSDRHLCAGNLPWRPGGIRLYDQLMVPPKRSYKRSPHRLAGFDYTADDHAYFLTIRAKSGSPFTDPRLARLVVETIEWLRSNRGILVYAYCVMPDHLHMLMQLPPKHGSGRQPEDGWPTSASEPMVDGQVPQNESGGSSSAGDKGDKQVSPGLSLSTVVHSLKSFTTRKSWGLGYRGQLWQDRSYDRILRRTENGRRVAEYILQNPVRKGLVTEAEAYKWSGAPDLL